MILSFTKNKYNHYKKNNDIERFINKFVRKKQGIKHKKQKNLVKNGQKNVKLDISEKKIMGWRDIMKKISAYILENWYYYLFAIICMILQVSLDMLSPFITRKIIDDVIINGQKEILNGLLLMILIIGMGRCIFGYLKEFTFDFVSAKIVKDIRKRLFIHIQGLSIRFFNETNTGEIMSRVKDDVDRLWQALGYVSMLIIEVVMHTLIIIWCMSKLNIKLTIIPLIAMPIVAMLAITMERKLDKVYDEISEENAILNTIAQENLSGVRTVKAFAREKFEIKKFLSHNRRYYELNMSQSRILVKYQPLFQFITKLLPIVAVIYGGNMVINGEISMGTLAAFIQYCYNIVWPMEMIGWLFNDFACAMASNKKIKKIYMEETEIKEKEDAIELDNVKGDIEFKNVSMLLDNQMILKDISFNVKKGQTIGIMGATGSGKSSVISLLQRFYDVSDGEILLDGYDIRDLKISTLRKNIALVMQEVFLFSDTISENVKLGKNKWVKEKEVKEALKYAFADGFIENMENSYDTIIGERGVGLSGGQKQRISIARAIAKKTPILIFDDSTSALDMETEHIIQENLKELNNITKIIIAHRISSVKDANEIIVLDEGRIIERGTHKELLDKRGEYYKTYLTQYGMILENNKN